MRSDDIVVTPTGCRFLGRRFPHVLGRGGIRRDKREGDGATPIGVHRIVGMFYRPDRMACPNPWAQPIRPYHGWSDDVADIAYNQLVHLPHDRSHERLWRADPLYDLILITDWNWPRAVAGAGSAIFLHRWRRPGYPTAGCVAFHPRDLLWIAARIGPSTRLIIPAIDQS